MPKHIPKSKSCKDNLRIFGNKFPSKDTDGEKSYELKIRKSALNLNY